VAPGQLVPQTLSPAAFPWIPVATPFAVYSAMVHGRDRWIAWPAVLVLLVLGSHSWEGPPGLPWRSQSLVFIAGPALLGMYVADRRKLLSSLVERAERAEREQHLLVERELGRERSRVAAEMHDVVTHRVSLMVLQAGALQVSTRDSEVRAAATQLRSTGCRALAELRDLVGLLHGTTVGVIAETAVTAEGLPDLTALVNESRAVGLPVDLLEQGDPATVAPIIARTAHRVVQEALTNVRKHAPGAQTRVSVRYGADGVRVTVRNSAPTGPVDAGLTVTGSGTGLTGLRHRVELVNGVLTAGPTGDPHRDGGFQVDARLPAYVPTAAALETAP
jgi:signal transduction histidine kinase